VCQVLGVHAMLSRHLPTPQLPLLRLLALVALCSRTAAQTQVRAGTGSERRGSAEPDPSYAQIVNDVDGSQSQLEFTQFPFTYNGGPRCVLPLLSEASWRALRRRLCEAVGECGTQLSPLPLTASPVHSWKYETREYGAHRVVHAARTSGATAAQPPLAHAAAHALLLTLSQATAT